MSNILFVTWDGGGNVPPLLAVAGELRDRGHRTHVLGHPGQRDAIERHGHPFAGLRRARPHSAADPAPGLRGQVDLVRLFGDPGPGEDVRDAISADRPDLIVVDCLMPSALRAAEASGLPTAVLGHTFGAYLRSWARGPVGVVTALQGFRPTRLWDRADLVLLATDADLDPAGAGQQKPNVRYTGPAQPVPDRSPAGDGPAVLVSLSTVAYPGMTEVLQRVLDAVATLPVRVLVTTGPVVDPATLRAGANTELVRYRPHAEVMPSVSAVVSHGGHATAMLALAHDLPLLVLPLHPFLDHRMIGDAVGTAGAGAVLSRKATPPQIRAAVEALLSDPGYREAAAVLGARIRAADGARCAADLLERLLAGRTSAPHLAG